MWLRYPKLNKHYLSKFTIKVYPLILRARLLNLLILLSKILTRIISLAIKEIIIIITPLSLLIAT